jgi:hypothetical protein
MSVLPMVVIPRNYPKYTSRRVHVAEWIDGEKLSQSTADDVGALVNLGVITYLTQLLEFGFFHAGKINFWLEQIDAVYYAKLTFHFSVTKIPIQEICYAQPMES